MLGDDGWMVEGKKWYSPIQFWALIFFLSPSRARDFLVEGSSSLFIVHIHRVRTGEGKDIVDSEEEGEDGGEEKGNDSLAEGVDNESVERTLAWVAE